VDTKKYKYNRMVQRRIPVMDRVLIFGYICICLMGASLVGMIVFAGAVLAKLQRVP
jgi:hypothetical protein